MIDPRLEPTLFEAFRVNPIWMFLAAVIAVAGVVLAVIGLVFAIKRSPTGIALGVAAALAGLLAVGIGAFDHFRRLQRIEYVASIPGLSARDVARIREYDTKAAQYPLFFGAGIGALPLLLGAGSAGAAAARKKPR